MFAIYAATSVESLDAVRAALGVEIQRLADVPVSRAELEGVQRRALGSLMAKNKPAGGCA